MRLSELNGKEIINLVDGTKVGAFYKVEAVCDLAAGRIHSFLLSERGTLMRREREIPWEAVRKISKDLLLVALAPEVPGTHGKSGQKTAGFTRTRARKKSLP
ncbi:MAG: YlmC/YmxH family sporulation protein [Firmicutes bacterium]|jgi:YlmC/YmxH family sporulation protein|nr:YlmC/YmxH family sporulation protein [Bacillota bacterium]